MEKHLFVTEDEEMSELVGGSDAYESPATDIKQEDEKELETSVPEKTHGAGVDAMVGENGDVDGHMAGENTGDDDPVLRTIPLVHGCVPLRVLQLLHLLQFPGRNTKQSFAARHVRSALKPESQVIQLQTPMDTARFYDDNRTEELGSRVDHVLLQGVLTAAGGLYAGKVVSDGESEKIVLTPLDSTAQLRASFKYIDDLDTARVAALKQENGHSDVKLATVHVLQTASKASLQLNTDGPVLGGSGSCLRHIKRFNEEPWLGLSWRDAAEVSASMQAPKMEPIAATAQLSTLI